jgi:hypothetical protein
MIHFVGIQISRSRGGAPQAREQWVGRVSSMKTQSSGGTLGLICIVLAVSAVDPAVAETPTPIPDYYAGVGARGLKGDALAAVLGSKIKLMDFGERTFSTRPALLLGGYDTEWRLPFTVEGKTNSHGFGWFGGVGLAYNMDDLGKTDAMVTGGIDVPFKNRLVLNVTIDYMWQDSISDVDGELLVSINYGF